MQNISAVNPRKGKPYGKSMYRLASNGEKPLINPMPLEWIQKKRLQELMITHAQVCRRCMIPERFFYRYLQRDPTICPLTWRCIADCVDVEIRRMEKKTGIPYTRPKVERFKPEHNA
jgi:hypothetical protein